MQVLLQVYCYWLIFSNSSSRSLRELVSGVGGGAVSDCGDVSVTFSVSAVVSDPICVSEVVSDSVCVSVVVSDSVSVPICVSAFVSSVSSSKISG